MTLARNAIVYLKVVSPSGEAPALLLPHDQRPAFRQLTKKLVVADVVDTGGSYTFIQNRHPSEDGLDLDQLHALAVNNLIDLADRRSLRVQPYQNIFGVLMGGGFEASLLLVDHLWESAFRSFVKGGYAAAIPARDVLAFCDAASTAGITELHQLIGRTTPGGDQLLSPKILFRRACTWVAQDG
jgi:uncharacterized protein YtpQ (UPF0354 family)